MHQPPAKMAEIVDMAVDADDRFRRRHRAARRHRRPGAAAPPERGDRRALEQVGAADKAGGEGADVIRRLDQHCARRIEAAEVIIRAGDVAHLAGIEEDVLFTGPAQRLAEAGIQRHAPGGCRCIDLAGGIDGLARHAVFLGGGFGKGDGGAVLRHFQPRCIGASAGIFAGRQIVRHIDHEAGIAPGRALADLAGFENDDAVVRAQFQQPAGRGQARKARADDQPVRRDVAFEGSGGKRPSADRLPAGDAIFHRQAPDGRRAHRTVSSRERSEMSIQMVFSSQ